jgi:predicted ribosome quality control (RQC) complex YloA/Tae2 family protein
MNQTETSARPSFDSVLAWLAVRELQSHAAGSFVRKIQQLSSELYLWTFYGGGCEHRLLMSMHPQGARLHLTEREYGHAETPSAFCMQLRKHVEGKRLDRAVTPGLERLAVLTFTSAEETRHVVVEMLPNQRNLTLCDENFIVLGERRAHRRRGNVLEVPAEHADNASTMDGATLLARLATAEPSVPLARALTQVSFGIGKRYAVEILALAGVPSDAPVSAATEALAAAWQSFWERVRLGPLEPTLQNGIALPFPFISVPSTDEPRHFETVSALCDAAFSDEGAAQAGLATERQRLLSALSKQIDKLERKRAAQQKDLRQAGEAETLRHWGDLLLANAHAVPRRASSVRLTDYDTGEAVDIPLDPERSAHDNAQHYYAQYKKARRGQELIIETLARTDQDIDYHETLRTAVETALTRDELRDMERQLIEERLLTAASPNMRRPKGPAAKPRHYSHDGWDIMVGRNPRQNELLSLRQAADDDLWFHARQIPGAHVIVRRAGHHDDPPDAVLLMAARLAAAFSKARQDTHVPVDYTRVKFLKKPPGTPPGYVTYSREKTLTVAPMKDLAEAGTFRPSP